MARSKKDLTTKTDYRFGPWAPMRGARGQAEAIQKRNAKPISPTEDRLVPGRGNLLQEGATSTTSRRGQRWRA